MIRDQKVKGGTYRPLIVVRPDGDIGGLDVCRAEEGEGPFRRNNVNFDVAVLESNVRKRVFLRKAAPTSRSSRTMRGAFMDATLPVVMSRTWAWSGERSMT